ncbi:MAG: hypothetical protein GTO49_00275 [Anaerolineae bacterium]|nr:hypothetical protein [Anaerolineae bacterium]
MTEEKVDPKAETTKIDMNEVRRMLLEMSLEEGNSVALKNTEKNRPKIKEART